MTRRRLFVCALAGLLLSVFGAGVVGAGKLGAATVPVKINFQPGSVPVPAGYTVDSGSAYSDTRGYGWVTQASLSGATHTPLDVTPNTRDRNVEPDQRLDTLIHMQYPASSTNATAVKTPAAWEYSVTNGSYSVTVAVGDGLAGTDPESHVIHVEGSTAVSGFVPSGPNGSSTRHAVATVTTTVSDGKLTIDAVGGTNTKLDFVDIAPVASSDTTPPAAPANVSASPGDGRVNVTWSANTEPDLAGYNVYRSTSSAVSLTSPLNGATLLKVTSLLDGGLTNGTTYYYAVQAVDTSGNKATSTPVSATPAAPGGSGTGLKVNFQSESAPVPSGYVRDFGEAYGPRSGANQGSGLTYGWVTPGTATPVSLVGNGRDRNAVADQRLDTFLHMQGGDVGGFSGITSPGAWEAALPNGSYTVSVTVGDAGTPSDSVHRIDVEGKSAVYNFIPSSAGKWATGIRTVTLSDGRLTIDPRGGTNTKIDYVEIRTATDVTPPAAVASLTATANSASSVSLSWLAGSDSDLAGYVVYRATAQSGPYSRINGPILSSPSYTDISAPAGTTVYYRVTALDQAGNESSPAEASVAVPGASSTFTTLSWVTVAPSPVTRSEAMGQTVNGKLYVFGGFGGSPLGPIRRSDAYDPVSNSWTRIADLPKPFTHGGCATDGRYIYLAGGYVGTDGGGFNQVWATTDVWRYDTATNTYTSMPPLPQARGAGGLVLFDGNLHFLGGADINRADKGDHWVLSLAGGTSWLAAAPLGNPRNHLGGVVLGGLLYAVGGNHGYDAGASEESTLEAWNPMSNTWSFRASLPNGLSHIAGATFALGDRIIVAGGDTAYLWPTAAVEAYSPASNTWVQLTPLPAPRDSGVANTSGGVLLYTTGANQATTYRGTPTG
jgi:fibronectin type 3 domain-containing protein/N-acetylneuraminic acid mutarotase